MTSDVMGGPEPDEKATDLMGSPESDEQATDVMGGSGGRS
jgi:hypothetical protein